MQNLCRRLKNQGSEFAECTLLFSWLIAEWLYVYQQTKYFILWVGNRIPLKKLKDETQATEQDLETQGAE